MSLWTDLSRCRSSRRFDGLERTIASATLCQKSYDLWRKIQNLSMAIFTGTHEEWITATVLMWRMRRSDLRWLTGQIWTFSALLKVSGFKDRCQVLSCHSWGLLRTCKRRKKEGLYYRIVLHFNPQNLNSNTASAQLMLILKSKTKLGRAKQWFISSGGSACSVQLQRKRSTAVSKLLCVKEQP